jgi:hypothetical protein
MRISMCDWLGGWQNWFWKGIEVENVPVLNLGIGNLRNLFSTVRTGTREGEVPGPMCCPTLLCGPEQSSLLEDLYSQGLKWLHSTLPIVAAG